jgi:hypothetical protein
MMIGSYMDESFDKQPSGIFAVRGFLGKGLPIFELERGWEKVLKREGLRNLTEAKRCTSHTLVRTPQWLPE